MQLPLEPSGHQAEAVEGEAAAEVEEPPKLEAPRSYPVSPVVSLKAAHGYRWTQPD